MKVLRSRTKTDRALNITISAEMKRTLDETARNCNVNMADIVRLCVRTMLPVLDALWRSQQIVLDELVARSDGHFRKRHSTLDSDDDYEAKQGAGPC